MKPTDEQLIDPKWRDENAPEWARFAACDKDGCWHWFECSPVASCGTCSQLITGNGRSELFSVNNWKQSIRGRPTSQPTDKPEFVQADDGMVRRAAKKSHEQYGEAYWQMSDKPEWDGTAKPPTGWHGECTWGERQNWFECVSLRGNFIALFKYSEWSIKHWSEDEGFKFRPIKTQAERQRDEVVEAAMELTCGPNDKRETITRNIIQQCLVELYGAGMLRKERE